MPVKKYRTEFVDLIDSIPLITPLKMFELLEQHEYIGQERARRAVCLMAYRHISRIKKIYVEQVDRSRLPSKENVLLIGPTGCGKTYLIELLFQKVLKIPTTVIDITSYSETGYVGQDVPTILTKLFFAARNNPELATIGIICIDEFDKISSGKNTTLFAGQGTSKDVTGIGVQRELLKLLEAGEIDVPAEMSHSSYAPRIVINTQDIPFIACGAFTGFKSVIRNISNINYSSEEGIGFNSSQNASLQVGTVITREDVEKAANFEAYGILPELIGRFSRIIPFDSLSEVTLREILKRNTVDKYSNELALDGISLVVEERVYDEIVKRCTKKETGARGLKSILTEFIEDACFRAYSSTSKKRSIHLYLKSREIEAEIIED
jgi:ATP-dependent Clp protease ATP-binding subunit ClpX